MARTITVSEVVDELTYLDSEGVEQELGTIRQEVYGDDEAKRFTFFPASGNPFAQKGKEETGYALGLGTAHMQFLNPADAQRAALDRGLQIQDILAYKGGLQLSTMYIDPENRWSDTLNYDFEFWSRQRREPGDVFGMMQLSTNLRIGHMAARYTPGIYRQICSNGLHSSILALPDIAVRHTEWETSNIDERLEDVEFGTGIVLNAALRDLTSMRYLGIARRLLERVSKEAASPLGLSSEMIFLCERFPTITNARLQGSYHQNYLEQLDLLLDSFEPSAPVKAIHILNAYTNAVNVERHRGSSRGAFIANESMNTIVTETVSLANLAAIFN